MKPEICIRLGKNVEVIPINTNKHMSYREWPSLSKKPMYGTEYANNVRQVRTDYSRAVRTENQDYKKNINKQDKGREDRNRIERQRQRHLDYYRKSLNREEEINKEKRGIMFKHIKVDDKREELANKRQKEDKVEIYDENTDILHWMVQVTKEKMNKSEEFGKDLVKLMLRLGFDKINRETDEGRYGMEEDRAGERERERSIRRLGENSRTSTKKLEGVRYEYREDSSDSEL